MADSQRHRSSTGLVLAVASAATFGTSGTFAASLLGAGWSPGAAVTVRITLAALVLAVPALVQLRAQWSVLRRSATTITAYGVLAIAAAQLCYFNAVAHLSVGVALLLEYFGTVMVVGWLWVRHGQRPRRLTVAGGVVAIVGLVLILDLVGSHHLDPIGVLWGMGAAVGLAFYFVLSARAEEPAPPLVVAWGGMCVGAVVLILFCLVGILPVRAPRTDVTLLHHRVSWVIPVLGISLVAAVFAYVAGIAAARRLGAKVASFIGLTEVVCAVLFAWLLLGQVPAPIQFLGGVFIIGGVVLVRVDELRTPTAAPPIMREDRRSRGRGRSRTPVASNR